MGYNHQESVENTINTMGILLGVHPNCPLRGGMIRVMEEILHQLRLAVYPTIYKVSYIPGGAGFLPSTVSDS